MRAIPRESLTFQIAAHGAKYCASRDRTPYLGQNIGQSIGGRTDFAISSTRRAIFVANRGRSGAGPLNCQGGGWSAVAGEFSRSPFERNLMSDLAKQLIAENKRTRAPFLDLGNCGLTELPAEVADLVWLESLSLSSGWLEWDGFQAQMRVSKNQGQANSGFRDIRSLRHLRRMRSLVLSGTQVADLAPLAGLSALTFLDVSNTQVADLAPLAGLPALTSLDVSHTKVADLAPLAGLSALTRPLMFRARRSPTWPR